MTSDDLIEEDYELALLACHNATDSRGLKIRLLTYDDASDPRLLVKKIGRIVDSYEGSFLFDDYDGSGEVARAQHLALLSNLLYRLVAYKRMKERRASPMDAGRSRAT